jgi:hypothetical protein
MLNVRLLIEISLKLISDLGELISRTLDQINKFLINALVDLDKRCAFLLNAAAHRRDFRKPDHFKLMQIAAIVQIDYLDLIAAAVLARIAKRFLFQSVDVFLDRFLFHDSSP